MRTIVILKFIQTPPRIVKTFVPVLLTGLHAGKYFSLQLRQTPVQFPHLGPVSIFDDLKLTPPGHVSQGYGSQYISSSASHLGQVGHQHGERTRRRARLGRCGVADPRGARSPTTAENLQGDAGAALGHGPVAAEDDVALLVEHAAQRPPGHPAQHGSPDGWGGRRGCLVVAGTRRGGGAGAPLARLLGPIAGSARAHSQGQWQTAPTRNSSAHGSVSSGAGS